MRFHVDRDGLFPVPEPDEGNAAAYWIVEMDEKESAEWCARLAFAKAEIEAFTKRLWDLDSETMNEKRQRRHRRAQRIPPREGEAQ